MRKTEERTDEGGNETKFKSRVSQPRGKGEAKGCRGSVYNASDRDDGSGKGEKDDGVRCRGGRAIDVHTLVSAVRSEEEVVRVNGD